MGELYVFLKWLHVLGATLLFGTGLGTAFHLWYTLRRGNIAAIASATRTTVLADWLFTLTSGILQPVTGVALASIAGFPLASTWIAGSIALYLVAAACWIPVVFIQIRMRDIAARCEREGTRPGEDFRALARRWFWLGWPAFASLAAVFGLMIAKPA